MSISTVFNQQNKLLLPIPINDQFDHSCTHKQIINTVKRHSKGPRFKIVQSDAERLCTLRPWCGLRASGSEQLELNLMQPLLFSVSPARVPSSPLLLEGKVSHGPCFLLYYFSGNLQKIHLIELCLRYIKRSITLP